MSDKQFKFEDGHWRDVWNDIPDTEPHPNDSFTWAEQILDLCGCADFGSIIDALLRYLNQGQHLHHDEDNLGEVMIAHLADNVGLAEHGTSIRSAWITDAGKRWVELAAGATGIRAWSPSTLSPSE